MAAKRKNEAVTVNGSLYNKRQRPDSFTHGPPPIKYPTYDDSARDADDDASERSWARNAKSKPFWHDANRHRGNDSSSYPFEQRSLLPLTTAVEGFKDIPDNGVLEYLQSVRDEAARLPIVFHSEIPDKQRLEVSEPVEVDTDVESEPNSEDLPQRIEDDFGYEDEYDEDYEEEEGEYYVEDGTYYEEGGDEADEDEEEYFPKGNLESAPEDMHPQVAYTSRISEMLLAKRALLRAPPKGKLAALDPKYKTQCSRKPEDSTTAHYIVSSRDPVPAQVARMKTSTIHALLASCRRLLKPNKNVSLRISAWFWALLARLPDVGQMDSDGIYDLRVLAKKAINLRCRFDHRAATIASRMGLGPVPQVVASWRLADAAEDHGEEGQNPSVPKYACGLKSTFAPNNGTLDGEAPASRPISEAISSNARQDAPGPGLRAEETNGEHNGEQAMELETDDEGNQDQNADTDAAALAAAKQRLASQLNDLDAAASEDSEAEEAVEDHSKASKEEATDIFRPTYPDVNTRATLDFIITVVGELYGQRDLLACRELWDAEEG